MRDGSDTRRIAIVTVHGTGDTAESPDGAKWFQRGSAFTEALKQTLSAAGVNADIVPLLWSGANSAMEREKASIALTRTIARLSHEHEGVHVLGHSHGGNVANDAACMLNWSLRRKRPKIATLTTVGTPFFRTRVTPAETLSAWALLVLLIVSVAAYGVMFLVGRSSHHSYWIALAVFAAALLIVAPIALAGALRVQRAGRKLSTKANLRAIWHPNDEAIAALQHVEKLQLEPFPRWSLFRGSRTGGAVWAASAAFIAPFIAWYVFLGMDTQHLRTPEAWIGYWLALLQFALLLPPAVYAAVYVLYRLAVALVFEFGLRNTMNTMIGGTLKGLAFGRDGDHRLCDVSPRSHYFETQEVVLDGAVAERMRDAAQEATRKLFDKYRNALFSAGADTSNVMTEIANDAMTWDSLVHTSYFDQPELAKLVAAHIVAAR